MNLDEVRSFVVEKGCTTVSKVAEAFSVETPEARDSLLRLVIMRKVRMRPANVGRAVIYYCDPKRPAKKHPVSIQSDVRKENGWVPRKERKTPVRHSSSPVDPVDPRRLNSRDKLILKYIAEDESDFGITIEEIQYKNEELNRDPVSRSLSRLHRAGLVEWRTGVRPYRRVAGRPPKCWFPTELGKVWADRDEKGVVIVDFAGITPPPENGRRAGAKSRRKSGAKPRGKP